MKHRLLVPALLGACLSVGAEDQTWFSGPADPYRYGMGVDGIALSGGYGGMFANPASLKWSDESLYVSVFHRDVGYIEAPEADVVLSFCGKNLGFTVEQNTTFSERDAEAYSALKYTHVQMDWAVRFHALSLGASVKAQTATKRTGVAFGDGARRTTDYLVETLFRRYEQKPNTNRVSASLGLLGDWDWVKLAVTCDDVASADNEGSLRFSGENLYENLNFGCSVASPTFNRESQLNLCKVIGSVELFHPMDSERCTFKAGVDVRLQFLPEAQLDILTGYIGPYDNEAIFDTNWGDGSQRFGLGLRLDTWRASLGFDVPFSWYRGEDADVTGMVSFAYVR